MNLTGVQQQNRACRENMVPSPAVRTHRSPVDDTDRRHPMKVPCKLVILIGTVKKFDAVQAGMTPNPGMIFASQRPLSMVFLDL